MHRLLGEVPSGSPKPTVGVDFSAHAVQLGSEAWPLRINVWDTSGDLKFRGMAEGCMHDLHDHDVVVFVYDLTNRGSFESIDNWAYGVRQASRDDPVCVLLGNKADLSDDRDVAIEEGEDKAKELGAALFAETGRKSVPGAAEDNIEELLKMLLRTQCCTRLPGGMSCIGDEVLPRRCISPSKWLQPVLRCAGIIA